MSQARKNIRAALLGQSMAIDTPGWRASQAAADYMEKQAPEVDRVLAGMGLLEIAQRALLAGDALETVGEAGPYGTAAQRRAWAAGKLSAAMSAMVVAEMLADNQTRISGRIANLEASVMYHMASASAAWKASGHDKAVPFREPRGRSVDWGSGADSPD